MSGTGIDDEIDDEFGLGLELESGASGATVEERELEAASADSTDLHAATSEGLSSDAGAANLLLAGAVGLFLAGLLPVAVLYEPDTNLIGGGLGDTYFGGLFGSWVVGVAFFMLALVPGVLAVLNRRNPSPARANTSFVVACVLFFAVIVPIFVVGLVLAFMPFSGILKFAKGSGFRLEVGPGAWLAGASILTMMVASVRMMSQERVATLRMGWLAPRRDLPWKLVCWAIALLIATSTMRIVPWVALNGVFKGTLPFLGPVDWKGDMNWQVGFLPIAGPLEFVGIVCTAAGLFMVVLSRGLLGPLTFVLGGWCVLVAAGVVASTTVTGPQPSFTNKTIPFVNVHIDQLDASVSKMTLGVLASAGLALVTIVMGLKWLTESQRKLVRA